MRCRIKELSAQINRKFQLKPKEKLRQRPIIPVLCITRLHSQVFFEECKIKLRNKVVSIGF
jgi:hypothetical protein